MQEIYAVVVLYSKYVTEQLLYIMRQSKKYLLIQQIKTKSVDFTFWKYEIVR